MESAKWDVCSSGDGTSDWRGSGRPNDSRVAPGVVALAMAMGSGIWLYYIYATGGLPCPWWSSSSSCVAPSTSLTCNFILKSRFSHLLMFSLHRILKIEICVACVCDLRFLISKLDANFQLKPISKIRFQVRQLIDLKKMLLILHKCCQILSNANVESTLSLVRACYWANQEPNVTYIALLLKKKKKTKKQKKNETSRRSDETARTAFFLTQILKTKIIILDYRLRTRADNM